MDRAFLDEVCDAVDPERILARTRTMEDRLRLVLAHWPERRPHAGGLNSHQQREFESELSDYADIDGV